MKELIKYHTRKYFKSNKIVMPFLCWMIYLKISYAQTNLNYVPNIVMSSGIIFFIMVWIGYSYQDIENPISEQLLILKSHSFCFYYISKILFLIKIAFILSVIGIGFPMMVNVCNNFRLFTRSITFADVILGSILHIIIAFLGVIVGSFFHSRIIKDKKLSVLMTITVALIGYTAGVIRTSYPITRFFIWIFPPVFDILQYFNKVEYFNLYNIFIPALIGCIYGMILLLIELYLLKKNKF